MNHKLTDVDSFLDEILANHIAANPTPQPKITYRLNIIADDGIAEMEGYDFIYWWSYGNPIVAKSEIMSKKDFNSKSSRLNFIEYNDLEKSGFVPFVKEDSFLSTRMREKIRGSRHYLVIKAKLPENEKMSRNKFRYEKDLSGNYEYGEYHISPYDNDNGADVMEKVFFTEFHSRNLVQANDAICIESIIIIHRRKQHAISHIAKIKLEREWKRIEETKSILSADRRDIERKWHSLEKEREEFADTQKRFYRKKRFIDDMLERVRGLVQDFDSHFYPINDIKDDRCRKKRIREMEQDEKFRNTTN